MCFSAEASLLASAAITNVGVVAVRKTENLPWKVFAAIPLLFGAQQFAEGLLWIGLEHNRQWTVALTYVFLWLAWVIWPVYVPLSVRLLEQKESRKPGLNLLLVIGAVVSAILAYVLVAHQVQAEVSGNHISYSIDYQWKYSEVLGLLYFSPIVVSLFISGTPRMWVVGSTTFLSFIVTFIFYREHLISVLCFFAAITSVVVLWKVYQMKRESSGLMHNIPV